MLSQEFIQFMRGRKKKTYKPMCFAINRNTFFRAHLKCVTGGGMSMFKEHIIGHKLGNNVSGNLFESLDLLFLRVKPDL